MLRNAAHGRAGTAGTSRSPSVMAGLIAAVVGTAVATVLTSSTPAGPAAPARAAGSDSPQWSPHGTTSYPHTAAGNAPERTSVRTVEVAVMPDTVTVTGIGLIQGTPDSVIVTFGVRVHDSTVEAAMNGTNNAARKVINALHDDGVDPQDVQTSGYHVGPYYDEKTDATNGYQAEETLTAHLHDIKKAGSIVSDAASVSGDDVTVDDMSLDLTSTTALTTSARDRAFEDAAAKARQYAKLSGRSLSHVVSVREGVQDSPDYSGASFGVAGGAAAAPVPIEAGQQPVSVVVTVVWAFS